MLTSVCPTHVTTVTTVLWPTVLDYPGEPVPEETFTHSHLTLLVQELISVSPLKNEFVQHPLHLRFDLTGW